LKIKENRKLYELILNLVFAGEEEEEEYFENYQ